MNAQPQETFDTFRINDCGTIGGSGIDAVQEIMPMIHGIATLFEAGFRKEINGQALFDSYNPELVASAFAGIAYLAAIAKFHADQL